MDQFREDYDIEAPVLDIVTKIRKGVQLSEEEFIALCLLHVFDLIFVVFTEYLVFDGLGLHLQVFIRIPEFIVLKQKLLDILLYSHSLLGPYQIADLFLRTS